MVTSMFLVFKTEKKILLLHSNAYNSINDTVKYCIEEIIPKVCECDKIVLYNMQKLEQALKIKIIIFELIEN